ncbi:MAG: succinate dehydrogenase, hydrophobic membrane anchor protein [Rickettsia sp.]|nr:succinate dehydrogenase, hydrophobic membrane anchor protein [Rickettsia sp.]
MSFFWINLRKAFKDFMDSNVPYNTKGSNVFRHWWHQRLAALFILLLTVLLTNFLVNILNTISIPIIVKLFKSPSTAFLLSFWIIAIFYHAALGMQVIIEDYVKNDKMKRIFILLIKIYSYLTMLTFFVVTVININKI